MNLMHGLNTPSATTPFGLTAYRLLSRLGVSYSTPGKNAYQIKVSGKHCKSLMFYPKSGKLVIQTCDDNRSIPFASTCPDVLSEKILSLI